MKNIAERIGILVQGTTLGILLYLALIELMVHASGARLFDYQAF